MGGRSILHTQEATFRTQSGRYFQAKDTARQNRNPPRSVLIRNFRF